MEMIVQWTNDNQGFLFAVLTLGYVFATFALVHSANKSNRLSLQLEQQRTRPHLMVSITRVTHESPCVSTLLKNVGSTAAHNVKVTWTPPLKKLTKPHNPAILDNNTFSYLPPGHEITDMLGTYPQFREAYPELRFQVALQYYDEQGVKYRHTIDLDYSYWLGINFGLTPSVTRELREISRAIKDSTHHIG